MQVQNAQLWLANEELRTQLEQSRAQVEVTQEQLLRLQAKAQAEKEQKRRSCSAGLPSLTVGAGGPWVLL